MDKRTFLKNAGLVGLAAPLAFAHLRSAVAAVEGRDAWEVASDEDFWRRVRRITSYNVCYTQLLRTAIYARWRIG